MLTGCKKVYTIPLRVRITFSSVKMGNSQLFIRISLKLMFLTIVKTCGLL